VGNLEYYSEELHYLCSSPGLDTGWLILMFVTGALSTTCSVK